MSEVFIEPRLAIGRLFVLLAMWVLPNGRWPQDVLWAVNETLESQLREERERPIFPKKVWK